MPSSTNTAATSIAATSTAAYGVATTDGFEVLLEDGIEEDKLEEHLRALEGEVRVTSPVGAAESAIKIHPTNTDIVVAGSNGPGGGQKMHYSTDGGESWTETTLPLGNTCCDPTIDYSSDGSKVYAATLGSTAPCCGIWVYRSADGGQTWTDLENEPGDDPRRELGSNGSDKEFIHVDKYTTSPFRDNVYLSWHTGNRMWFASSTDEAHTWNLVDTGENFGIGSDIVTDKTGRVYHFWPNFVAEDIKMQRSTNGGVSFDATSSIASTNDGFDFPIPAMDARLVFIYVSADADLSDGPYGGSVYAAWTDTLGPESGTAANNHARIQVGYTRDGGDTWNVSTPHPTGDMMTVDRFHQWLAVGPDGTVHIVYYDTGFDGDRETVDLYYTFSTDGAQTWSTPRRETSVTSPRIDDGFEWGDYNGLDAVLDRVMSVFTDNRNEGGGGADSMDIYSTAFTVAGAELFADGFESGNTLMWSVTFP